MIYSKEEVYKYSGQFDKTVTVSFTYDSEARKKYGYYITGLFYYTPKERIEYEKIIENNEYEKNDGFIKFIANANINQLTQEQVNDLRFDGFLASEIIEILQFSSPSENPFSKKDIRKLPTPITVNVDLSNRDEDEMILWVNSQRMKNGYKLIPEEISRHNGIILRKYEGKINDEDIKHFKDPETGKIKTDIKYQYLKSKFYRDLLSDEEKIELENLIKKDVNEKVEILGKELKKSQGKWKTVGLNYNQQLYWLINYFADFRPVRLTHGNIPVWWDFESILHIYMRHVKETKIGERFEPKTIFQYKFEDIERVIKLVLKKTEKEIIKHFTEKPDKEFKKVGEQSIYFDGDYYVFHINPDGRLRDFYKNN